MTVNLVIFNFIIKNLEISCQIMESIDKIDFEIIVETLEFTLVFRSFEFFLLAKQ